MGTKVECIRDSIINNDKNIAVALTKLGMSPSLDGYRYLKTAVIYSIENPDSFNLITKRLYYDISYLYGTSCSKVERAIRYAILLTEDKNTEFRQQLLSDFGPNGIAHYSNKEFIGIMSEYIRYECNE